MSNFVFNVIFAYWKFTWFSHGIMQQIIIDLQFDFLQKISHCTTRPTPIRVNINHDQTLKSKRKCLESRKVTYRKKRVGNLTYKLEHFPLNTFVKLFYPMSTQTFIGKICVSFCMHGHKYTKNTNNLNILPQRLKLIKISQFFALHSNTDIHLQLRGCTGCTWIFCPQLYLL